jgi:uncharacterized membrane protein (UPF0127 family)
MRLAPLLLLLAVACGSAEEASDPSASPALSIRTDDGTVSLDVQVADTPAERRTGLMGRESLSPYDGMVFVWEEPVVNTFWMKDTLIPLSIAFADADGTIVSILDMEPCEADPCEIYDPGAVYRSALEVNQGAFDDLGVQVGDRLSLEP